MRHSLLRRPLAVGSAAVLALLVCGCLLAPALSPYSPTATDLDHVLSGPSTAHWLGTDGLGRDELSRLMYGGRLAFLHAVIAVGTLFAVGVTAGLIAGFFRGWLDRLFGWVTDLLLAIPALVLLLTVLAFVGHNTSVAMVALGLLSSPGVARLVRGSTLGVRQELYVAAARISGIPNRHIITRHVLPRVAGPIIVQLSLGLGGALMIDAGLSYLGFGPQPPTPTWGGMLSDAATVIDQQSWLLVPPGVVIGVAIVALGLIGDAVRDATAERTSRSPAARPARRRPASPSSRSATAARGLLSLHGVTIALPTGHGVVPVVTDLSLHIAPGETVGLVGESGCGKSIAGKAVLGLLPAGGQVSAGGIWLDGVDLTDPKVLHGIRGRHIGFISQEPMASLDPVYTAGQQVAELVRRHHGGTRAQAQARALQLLRDVNLADPQQVARSYPHQLSGGMAQRVAIAMALAGEPRLLIADEPTTALDVTVQAEILGLLSRLQEQRGMAILLISHDLGVVAQACDRVYVIYAGQVVESATTVDLFDQPRHPYTAGLLKSTPRLGTPGQPLTALPGTVPDPADWPVGCRLAARCALSTVECEVPVPLLDIGGGRHTRCVHHDQVGKDGDDRDQALAGRA